MTCFAGSCLRLLIYYGSTQTRGPRHALSTRATTTLNANDVHRFEYLASLGWQLPPLTFALGSISPRAPVLHLDSRYWVATDGAQVAVLSAWNTVPTIVLEHSLVIVRGVVGLYRKQSKKAKKSRSASLWGGILCTCSLPCAGPAKPWSGATWSCEGSLVAVLPASNTTGVKPRRSFKGQNT